MLIPTPKNCDVSVKKAIQLLSTKLDYNAERTFGALTLSKTCNLAAGINVLRVTGLQTDNIAMTGTLRGAYIDVSNGALAATGTIRALELKARTEAPGDTGNNVAVLEGLSISADSKAHNVTTMRAAEFILDGKTGGTIGEAVGLRIANNLQVDKATTSYGLQIYRDSFDYTYDISLSLGGHITGDSYVNQDLRTTASPTFAGLILSGTKTYGIDLSSGTWSSACLNLDAIPKIFANGTQIIKFDDINENLFLGTLAFNNDEATKNVGIGYHAGYYNDITGGGLNGTRNVYIGYEAGSGSGFSNKGYYNLAVGYRALFSNTTGTQNVAVGTGALYENTEGYNNFALGSSALQNNTTGDNNVAISVGAMFYNSLGNYNVAIGYQSAGFGAGGVNSFWETTIIGARANYSNTTGQHNVIIGFNSGYSLTNGHENIFIGYKSGYRQTTNDNLLIIDDRIRADAATEITNAIMYGVMAAAPADQSLRINAEILGSDGAKIGDGGTANYLDISATGDAIFVGTAGLAFGCLKGIDETVTCIVEDTWYQVTFDAAGPVNLIEADTANNELEVDYEGIYQVGVIACFHSNPSNDFELIVKKTDGTVDLAPHLFQTTAVADKVENTTGYCLIDINASDRVELWVRCTSAAGQNAVFDHVSLTLTQIGGT